MTTIAHPFRPSQTPNSVTCADCAQPEDRHAPASAPSVTPYAAPITVKTERTRDLAAERCTKTLDVGHGSGCACGCQVCQCGGCAYARTPAAVQRATEAWYAQRPNRDHAPYTGPRASEPFYARYGGPCGRCYVARDYHTGLSFDHPFRPVVV